MPLKSFSKFPFTHDGKTRTVFRKGSGPSVAIMHEIPGITPEVRRLRRARNGLHIELLTTEEGGRADNICHANVES